MISNERCARIVGILALVLSSLMTRSGASQPLQMATKLNNWQRTKPARVQIYEYNNPIRDTRTVPSRQTGVHAENGNAVENGDVLALELHMQQLLAQLVEMSRDTESNESTSMTTNGGVQPLNAKQLGDLRSRYRNVDIVDEFGNDSYQKDTSKHTYYNGNTNTMYGQLHSNARQITPRLDYNESHVDAGESLDFNEIIVLPASNLYSQEFQLAQKGEKNIVKLTSLSQQTDFEKEVKNDKNNNKISEVKGPKETDIEPPMVALSKIEKTFAEENGRLLMSDKYLADNEKDAQPSAKVEQKMLSDKEMTGNIFSQIKNGELNHVMKRQENRIKEDTKEIELQATKTIQNVQKLTIKNMAEQNKNDSEHEEDNDIDESDDDVDYKSADDDVDAMPVMSNTAAVMHSTLMSEHTETEADNDKREEKEMDIVSADNIVNNDADDNDVDDDDNARDKPEDALTRTNISKGNATEDTVTPSGAVNKTSTNNEDIILDMLHKRMESIQEHDRYETGGANEHMTDVKLSKKKLAGIASYRDVNSRTDEGASQENVTVDEDARPDIFPLSYMSHSSDYVNMHSKFLTRHNNRTQNEVTTELKETTPPKGVANIVWVFGQEETAKMSEMPQLDTVPYIDAARMAGDHNLAEIETTNWWRKLPYAEIRSFLNTIHT